MLMLEVSSLILDQTFWTAIGVVGGGLFATYTVISNLKISSAISAFEVKVQKDIAEANLNIAVSIKQIQGLELAMHDIGAARHLLTDSLYVLQNKMGIMEERLSHIINQAHICVSCHKLLEMKTATATQSGD